MRKEESSRDFMDIFPFEEIGPSDCELSVLLYIAGYVGTVRRGKLTCTSCRECLGTKEVIIDAEIDA